MSIAHPMANTDGTLKEIGPPLALPHLAPYCSYLGCGNKKIVQHWLLRTNETGLLKGPFQTTWCALAGKKSGSFCFYSAVLETLKKYSIVVIRKTKFQSQEYT
jgi:hypothetical protein